MAPCASGLGIMIETHRLAGTLTASLALAALVAVRVASADNGSELTVISMDPPSPAVLEVGQAIRLVVEYPGAADWSALVVRAEPSGSIAQESSVQESAKANQAVLFLVVGQPAKIKQADIILHAADGTCHDRKSCPVDFEWKLRPRAKPGDALPLDCVMAYVAHELRDCKRISADLHAAGAFVTNYRFGMTTNGSQLADWKITDAKKESKSETGSDIMSSLLNNFSASQSDPLVMEIRGSVDPLAASVAIETVSRNADAVRELLLEPGGFDTQLKEVSVFPRRFFGPAFPFPYGMAVTQDTLKKVAAALKRIGQHAADNNFGGLVTAFTDFYRDFPDCRDYQFRLFLQACEKASQTAVACSTLDALKKDYLAATAANVNNREALAWGSVLDTAGDFYERRKQYDEAIEARLLFIRSPWHLDEPMARLYQIEKVADLYVASDRTEAALGFLVAMRVTFRDGSWMDNRALARIDSKLKSLTDRVHRDAKKETSGQPEPSKIE
jgi:hypothetical protein